MRAHPQPPVRIGFVGDIYIEDEDALGLVKEITPLTSAFDVMIGNLEIPVCDEGEPMFGKRRSYLRARPSTLEALNAAGFTLVSVANNHAMNYGWTGLRQMFRLLEAAGIGHAGGGEDLRRAHAPAIQEARGRRVALLGYTSVYTRDMFEARPDRPGLATVEVNTMYEPPPRVFEMPGIPALVRTAVSERDLALVAADIAAARAEADYVVVSWHWGNSLRPADILPYQVELAHAAIDYGADCVVGHHSHLVSPIEFYDGGVICYGIGNFSHALEGATFPSESAVLELEFDGTATRVAIHPVWLDEGFRPRPLDPDDVRVEAIKRQLLARGPVEITTDAARRCLVIAPSPD